VTRRRSTIVLVLALTAAATLAGCGSGAPDLSAAQPSRHSLGTVAGYVVPWDSSSIAATATDAVTEVSPVWYQPTANGQIVFASAEAKLSESTVEAQASKRHIAVIPTISNYVDDQWDGGLIHQLISNMRLRAAHITSIVDLVSSHQWAGIDLDYESLGAEDRAAYSLFIHDIAAALHHVHKRLTLTVHAKTAEPGDWSGAEAQDWRALGASADEVRVMAYDYSSDDTAPGPIAPISWVESVLQLAVAEVPREKIVLGLATYGYDWAGSELGQDVQWSDASSIARAHGVPIKWDPTSQSPWFTYTDSHGTRHTVWFEDAQSLQGKLDLALRYQIGGVVLWRLGGEDPAIWGLIHRAE
jgi:spore germination protein